MRSFITLIRLTRPAALGEPTGGSIVMTLFAPADSKAELGPSRAAPGS